MLNSDGLRTVSSEEVFTCPFCEHQHEPVGDPTDYEGDVTCDSEDCGREFEVSITTTFTTLEKLSTDEKTDRIAELESTINALKKSLK